MELSRRRLLGVLAASAVAGCSGTEPSGSDDSGGDDTGGTGTVSGPETESGNSNDGATSSGDTAPGESCASLLSPLHELTVSERGPLDATGDATEAYAFSEQYESGTVTTYGGQERPAAIRRTDDSSVTYYSKMGVSGGLHSG